MQDHHQLESTLPVHPSSVTMGFDGLPKMTPDRFGTLSCQVSQSHDSRLLAHFLILVEALQDGVSPFLRCA